MAHISERTKLVSQNYENWSEELVEELEHCNNLEVGQNLLEENNRVKVWTINLKPGERIRFHKHTLSYFWIAHTEGKAISRFENGDVKEMDYLPNDMAYFTFENGNYMIHDLKNIGQTTLSFTTVELKN